MGCLLSGQNLNPGLNAGVDYLIPGVRIQKLMVLGNWMKTFFYILTCNSLKLQDDIKNDIKIWFIIPLHHGNKVSNILLHHGKRVGKFGRIWVEFA